MKKQQVKAILDITKNEYRQPLTYLQIDLYNDKPVLVATDSYTLIALYADESMRDKIGHGITRNTLEVWYKLASGRDTLDFTELETEKHDTFPKWQQILEATEQKPSDQLGFDSKLASRLETIAGERLYYKLSGNDRAMVANTEKGLFVLMPLKPKKGV